MNGVLDEHTVISKNAINIQSEATFHALLELPYERLLEWSCVYEYSGLTKEDYPFPLALVLILDETKRGFSSLTIEALLNFFHWDKPYSVTELATCYRNACKRIRGVKLNIDLESNDDPNITFDCFFRSKKIPVKKYFDLAITALNEAHASTQHLLERNHEDGLTSIFCFPPEIKTAATQYLLYFGQFLEDLGIEAFTSLKEELNRILFTVTPKDKDQALDWIRQVLAIYLQAPASGFADDLQDSSIAHFQWKANIHHLRSQLELARAMIQVKEATIDALQLTNYRLQDQLNVQQQALADSNTTEKTEEEIFGGAASITKVKLKGLTINLPYILRRLRRK
ncbi:hypothetical protein GCM10011511_48990 [Puia dinghuensis]|uniref:Uncharacterized protein n=1 Tax=Puia dinghuensis TaxID=1792502 RepID=A0A8J2UI68_9BACT|nr:hypothetical protein GCM10011511_48990 [Puia dinghuensis]